MLIMVDTIQWWRRRTSILQLGVDFHSRIVSAVMKMEDSRISIRFRSMIMKTSIQHAVFTAGETERQDYWTYYRTVALKSMILCVDPWLLSLLSLLSLSWLSWLSWLSSLSSLSSLCRLYPYPYPYYYHYCELWPLLVLVIVFPKIIISYRNHDHNPTVTILLSQSYCHSPPHPLVGLGLGYNNVISPYHPMYPPIWIIPSSQSQS